MWVRFMVCCLVSDAIFLVIDAEASPIGCEQDPKRTVVGNDSIVFAECHILDLELLGVGFVAVGHRAFAHAKKVEEGDGSEPCNGLVDVGWILASTFV